ncbi:hypothetical protein AYI70_g2532 [Smittium culicis]|uniref:Uncharacterized protein n=1 Tax=Smittium culicis TaxID=133412 RepID=A0A1R1Y7S6_9FUNG|nr:hypothetical protein AYI70_g2532 [Smittium culicis]
MPYPQDDKSSVQNDLSFSYPTDSIEFDVSKDDINALHTEVPESWNYLDNENQKQEDASYLKNDPIQAQDAQKPDIYKENVSNDDSSFNG